MNLLKKILLSFLAIVFVLLIGFAFIYAKLAGINTAVGEMRQQYFQNYVDLSGIAQNIERQIASYRLFVSTKVNPEKALNQVGVLKEENDAMLAALTKRLETDEERKLLQEVQQTGDAWVELMMGKFGMQTKNAPDQALLSKQRNEQMLPLATKLQEDVRAARDLNEAYMQQKFQLLDEAAAQVKQILLFIGALIFILTVTIGVLLAKDITRAVRRLGLLAARLAEGDLTQKSGVVRGDELGALAISTDHMVGNVRAMLQQIQAASEQVSTSSEELTASADQSAQAVAQVAASVMTVTQLAQQQAQALAAAIQSVECISGNIEQAAGCAGASSEQAEKAAQTARDGTQKIQDAVAQMQAIETAVDDSAAVVGKLGERSNEIGAIVDTISGIAGQTNLLALNAAIEAARAGEQGRGFAVVAEEVRKLAEQSQQAAGQIADLIAQIRLETETAVSTMHKGTEEVKTGAGAVAEAGSAFEQIAGVSQSAAGSIDAVVSAVQTAAETTQVIVEAIRKVEAMSGSVAEETQSVSAATEQQSATMDEIAAASRNLAGMAQRLQTQVDRFKL